MRDFPIGFYIIELAADESADWQLTHHALISARSAYHLGVAPTIYEGRRGQAEQPPFRGLASFSNGIERRSCTSIFVEGRWPMLWYGGPE